MEKHTTFEARGRVLGNLWGGGEGSYDTIRITGDSLAEVTEKAEQALKNGSLDSGMGFESLIGARMTVVKTTTITVDGLDYSREDDEELVIGNMTEAQMGFLEESLYWG